MKGRHKGEVGNETFEIVVCERMKLLCFCCSSFVLSVHCRDVESGESVSSSVRRGQPQARARVVLRKFRARRLFRLLAFSLSRFLASAVVFGLFIESDVVFSTNYSNFRLENDSASFSLTLHSHTCFTARSSQ